MKRTIQTVNSSSLFTVFLPGVVFSKVSRLLFVFLVLLTRLVFDFTPRRCESRPSSGCINWIHGREGYRQSKGNASGGQRFLSCVCDQALFKISKSSHFERNQTSLNSRDEQPMHAPTVRGRRSPFGDHRSKQRKCLV